MFARLFAAVASTAAAVPIFTVGYIAASQRKEWFLWLWPGLMILLVLLVWGWFFLSYRHDSQPTMECSDSTDPAKNETFRVVRHNKTDTEGVYADV